MNLKKKQKQESEANDLGVQQVEDTFDAQSNDKQPKSDKTTGAAVKIHSAETEDFLSRLKPTIYLMIVCIVITYAYKQYKEVEARKQSEVSMSISNIQSAIKELPNATEEDKQKSLNILTESIKQLDSTDLGETSKNVVELYKALATLTGVKSYSNQQRLELISQKDFGELTIDNIPDKLISEFSIIILLRQELNQKTKDAKDEDLAQIVAPIRTKLIGSIDKIEILIPEAISLLERISFNSEQREETKSVVQGIVDSRPELADKLSTFIDQ